MSGHLVDKYDISKIRPFLPNKLVRITMMCTPIYIQSGHPLANFRLATLSLSFYLILITFPLGSLGFPLEPKGPLVPLLKWAGGISLSLGNWNLLFSVIPK